MLGRGGVLVAWGQGGGPQGAAPTGDARGARGATASRAASSASDATILVRSAPTHGRETGFRADPRQVRAPRRIRPGSEPITAVGASPKGACPCGGADLTRTRSRRVSWVVPPRVRERGAQGANGAPRRPAVRMGHGGWRMGGAGKAAVEHRSERTRGCVSEARRPPTPPPSSSRQPHTKKPSGEDRGLHSRRRSPRRSVL